MTIRRLATALLLAAMAFPAAATAATATASPPVRLYYFHRNIRCTTCVALGDITSWVAEVSFRDEIASGELAFEMVNYQSPGNEHFAEDFALEQPSAVLAACDGDSVTSWRNLERIWELSEDHKGLEAYLKAEIRAFLGRHGPGAGH